MDIALITVTLVVSLLGLAIFSNQARARHCVDFALKPNCLLTRWPLLFVTGPRSLFYFSAYWNLYTSFLAEHGYEVFTLHLPWSDHRTRQQRLEQFLNEQEKAHRHFHFFVDPPTMKEFEDFLQQRKSEAVKSLTEITDPTEGAKKHTARLYALPFPTGQVECLPATQIPYFLSLAFSCHKVFFKNQRLPTLSTLGAPSDVNLSNCLLLLARAQVLAEMDLREDL